MTPMASKALKCGMGLLSRQRAKFGMDEVLQYEDNDVVEGLGCELELLADVVEEL
jgi:hypothetical protein